MAYKPFYQITDQQNIPVQRTPINRTNLLHMENGIKETDNRIIHLDTEELEKLETNLMARSAVIGAGTGIVAATLLNSTVCIYDLDIEHMIVNFDVTGDNILILTLANGTKKRADLIRFVYGFSSTATIMVKMVNRKVTTEIVNGSVIMAKLDSSIQGTFLQYLLDAKSARDLALQYQKNVKRYAVSDAESDGNETDNAEYYYDQSKKHSEIVQKVTAITYPSVYVDIGSEYLLAIDGNNFYLSLDLSGYLISQIRSGETVWLQGLVRMG